MLLGEVLCTTCNGAGLEMQPDGGALCRFCGALNHPGTICPRCLEVTPDEAEACPSCNQALALNCPVCHTRNWVGRESCLQCRTPLDALSFMADRYQRSSQAAQQEHLRSIRSLQAGEAESSRQRMAQLNEIEARRQADLRAANARRLAEERRIVTGFFIALGVLAAALVIGGLFILLGS